MTAYCVFNVGRRRVGIEMTHVREIIERDLVQPVPVPLAPKFMVGLFNLRGQVLPYLNLAQFVGTDPGDSVEANRAVIVERGEFRFATAGQQIDTAEFDPATVTPPPDAALFPALEGEAKTERGSFHIIHTDRLEACLSQALRFGELLEPVLPAA